MIKTADSEEVEEVVAVGWGEERRGERTVGRRKREKEEEASEKERGRERDG